MMIRLTAAALAMTVTFAGAIGPRLHAQSKSAALLNANTASEADLAAVPHLNAAFAKSIAARRPFRSVTDLDALLTSSGLNRTQITEVYRHLFVPVNLNTGTDAEILLIPGVGKRLLHEFKEYRPYTAIEQFRREIGKYVSKEEVARLERYVTIK
jgi:DNA uptake protein ComE-like DNA-binding protein